MSLVVNRIDQNICRLCCENIGAISLFGPNSIIQLCDKIMYCVKFTISEDDGLPANICSRCEDDLSFTYNFIFKCEESDKKLRSIDFSCMKVEFKPELEIKEENELSDCDVEDFFETHNDVKGIVNIKSSDVLENQNNLDLGVTQDKWVRKKGIKGKTNKSCISKCKECGRICNNPSTLRIHMRSHTNERPYACSTCEKKYKDGGSLKRHIERNHSKEGRERKFICDQCGKGFYTKNDCKIHMRVHTGETPYACSICPARYTQIGSLQIHQKLHTGERNELCTICNKKFATRDQLKKHLAVHTSEKKYSCPVCKGLFKHKNNMKKHLKIHSAQDYKKFICNYCGSTYSFKGNLRIHIKKQHSSKSGFCNDCQKYVPNIETHMWKHTGERPLKCKLCSSTHYNLKGLTQHYTFRHKFANKYECPHNDCTLKFPTQSMLEYHVTRYHNLEKPFPCNKCSRRFYRRSDLARHKKGTHKEPLK